MWHLHPRSQSKCREAPEKYPREREVEIAKILKQIKEYCILSNAHIPGFKCGTKVDLLLYL
jgi:hypothetical protein